VSEIDPEAVARWRELGLSDAEIGRRLGVSAEALRDLAGLNRPVGPDDDAPDSAALRPL
jgi:hypothetical protein